MFPSCFPTSNYYRTNEKEYETKENENRSFSDSWRCNIDPVLEIVQKVKNPSFYFLFFADYDSTNS